MLLILVPAGIAFIAAALYHGYLGQARLIGPSKFPNRQAQALVAMIWQFSTACWAACGALIALSPWLFDANSRRMVVICACLPVCWGIIGNFWITRGRHFGWKIFAAIVAAAVAGAYAS